MTQENQDAQVIAAECIRQSEEGNYERALFRRAGEYIQRLLAELEAVGAGGVQPLRAQQETPVVRALQSAILSGLSHEELLEKAHYLMTLTVNQALKIGELQEAAAPKAPQQAAPVQGHAEQFSLSELDLMRQWFNSMQDTNGRYIIDDDMKLHEKIVAALKATPQQAAPAAPAPQQKPKLRVGQLWRTRCGVVAKIVTETTYPFRCISEDHDNNNWSVTADGRLYSNEVDTRYDLIELISDVPQEGGEA